IVAQLRLRCCALAARPASSESPGCGRSSRRVEIPRGLFILFGVARLLRRYAMKISKAAPKSIGLIAAQLAMLGLPAFTEAALGQFRGQGAPQPAPDPNYEWSAVLVSYDQSARTAVVRARVASHAKIEGLERFAPGQR